MTTYTDVVASTAVAASAASGGVSYGTALVVASAATASSAVLVAPITDVVASAAAAESAAVVSRVVAGAVQSDVYASSAFGAAADLATAVASVAVAVSHIVAAVATHEAVASSAAVVSAAPAVAVIRPAGHVEAADNFAGGYVMNGLSAALSRVAVPIIEFAGDLVAVAGGVGTVGGDLISGSAVQAAVDYGHRSFGTTEFKRLDTVYAHASSVERLHLAVEAGGKRVVYAARSSGSDMSPRRFDIGKGLTAGYFNLTVQNQNGADFVVDGVEARVSTTRRA